MENRLETEFNEIVGQDGIIGCVVADPQGLCLKASPNLKGEIAGLVAAVAQHANLIEPTSTCQPVIVLENDTRQCLIHNDGGITTALFKKVQSN